MLPAAVLLTSQTVSAKVYRWVDENGEVHYTESLPPDFEDIAHDVLDNRGIVLDENLTLSAPSGEIKEEDVLPDLPTDASGMKRAKALYSEKETQQRMDNFLMLRYKSEQEIEDAMEVEIKQLDYDRRLLETSRHSMATAYRGQLKEAANRQRAGVEVDDETQTKLVDLRKRIDNNARSLHGLVQREVKIRKSFGVELKRYKELVEMYSQEDS
jgi:hypothetical protein